MIFRQGVSQQVFFLSSVVGSEERGRERTISVNDTLRNLSPIMDYALKDDTLSGGKSPNEQHKKPNKSMMDSLRKKASSATQSPLFPRKSRRRRDGGNQKYNTIGVFPRSLVETTAAMLVTEDDSP